MSAVTHIAGMSITVGPLMRQRCAWCGHLLIDYDLERVAVPVGQDSTPATWPPGELVRVDGNLSTLVDHSDGDLLPVDACPLAELAGR